KTTPRSRDLLGNSIALFEPENAIPVVGVPGDASAASPSGAVYIDTSAVFEIFGSPLPPGFPELIRTFPCDALFPPDGQPFCFPGFPCVSCSDGSTSLAGVTRVGFSIAAGSGPAGGTQLGIAVAGAPGGGDDTGAAFLATVIFLQLSIDISELRPVEEPVTGARFGRSVAVVGGKALVGAPFDGAD